MAMATKTSQVTVEEYINQFFLKYLRSGYGKTSGVNADAGAEALLAMLKLVWQKGGKEDMKAAFHCFKDQLSAAKACALDERVAIINDLFMLMSSLIRAAEQLRQFSPVKETLSAAILNEARGRLHRILVGDGFALDADIRRKALDCCFECMLQEQAEKERNVRRKSQLLGQMREAKSAPARGRAALQLKVGGPDLSSWEALWSSLVTMPGQRMFPLLQSVMTDMHAFRALSSSSSSTSNTQACQVRRQQSQASHETSNGQPQPHPHHQQQQQKDQQVPEPPEQLDHKATEDEIAGAAADEEGEVARADCPPPSDSDVCTASKVAAGSGAAATAGGRALEGEAAQGKGARGLRGSPGTEDDVTAGQPDRREAGSQEVGSSSPITPQDWVQFNAGQPCSSSSGPGQKPLGPFLVSLPTEAAAGSMAVAPGHGEEGSDGPGPGWPLTLDSPVAWEAEFPVGGLPAVSDLHEQQGRAASARA